MRIRANLREFCVEVNHMLNVDDASRIDVVPPSLPPSTPSTPTTTSQQTVDQVLVQRVKGGGKRVAATGLEKTTKKKHQIIDDDEVIYKLKN